MEEEKVKTDAGGSAPLGTDPSITPKMAGDEAQTADEDYELEPPMMTLKLQTPDGKMFTLDSVSSGDTVQGVRQLISELPELCAETCYHLECSNEANEWQTLNDYLEVSECPNLRDGALLRMIPDSYDIKRARAHVRRFKDLLINPPVATSVATKDAGDILPTQFSGTDGRQQSGKGKNKKSGKASKAVGGNLEASGDSLKSIISKVAKLDCPVRVSLDRFFTDLMSSPDNQEKVSSVGKGDFLVKCLKSVSFSGFNPPPGFRRLQGDLFYLEVVVTSKESAHITACPAGFYVNKSTNDHFDPTPAKKPFLSRTLLELLQSISPYFQDRFDSLLKQTAEIANEGPASMDVLIATSAKPLSQFHWNTIASDTKDHAFDPSRAEEDLMAAFGVEEKGMLRDWNEEYQCCKELSRASLKERIARSRVLYKVTTEFAEAATSGAVAIVQGQVPPLNPMDPPASHVYVYNNIFFSLASDMRDTSTEEVGDGATLKSSNHDLMGVNFFNDIDVAGLHTLATTIVDYMGTRVVAQSIVPGILQGEAASTLVYGSVDNGNTIASDPAMHKLMCEAGKFMGIATRTVKPLGGPKSGESPSGISDSAAGVDPVEICGPVDCKGIRGADGRNYILDLVRITPPDWAMLSDGSENTKADDSNDQSTAAKLKTYLLRPELVHLYLRWRKNKARLAEQVRKKAEEDEKKAQPAEGKIKAQTVEVSSASAQPKSQDSGAVKNASEDLEKAESQEIDANDTVVNHPVSLNVNVFMSYSPSVDPEEADQDTQTAKDASKYLQEAMIPSFVNDVIRGVIQPVDGLTLTQAMHGCGINMRYLGKLADLVAAFEEKTSSSAVRYFLPLLEAEMIARASKRIFAEILAKNDVKLAPGPSVTAFLNDLFSDIVSTNDVQNGPQKGKRANAGKIATPVDDVFSAPEVSLGHQDFWERIKTEVKTRFNYSLQIWTSAEEKNSARRCPMVLLRRVCQRTGIQVITRDYKFDIAKPFRCEDIADICPIVKTSVPKKPLVEATNLLDQGRLHLATGSLQTAYQYFQEAAILLYQVCGAAHVETATTTAALAMALYEGGDFQAAILQQQRALAIYSQTQGLDHPDTAHCHATLASFHLGVSEFTKAITHFRRSIYLQELTGGEFSQELSVLYYKMGLAYRELGVVSVALRCHFESLKRYDGDHLHGANVLEAIAWEYGSLGFFREAIQYEKRAYALYQSLLGEEDARTVASAKRMTLYTEKAVEGAKSDRQKDQQAESDALAADLIAQEEAERKSQANKKKKSQK